MGSLKGSLFDQSERKNTLSAARKPFKLHTLKAASNVAMDQSADARDITFRPSDVLSDGSLNDSPESIIHQENSQNKPDDLEPRNSANYSNEGLASHADSPGSFNRLKAKTVSFKLARKQDDMLIRENVSLPKEEEENADSEGVEEEEETEVSKQPV